MASKQTAAQTSTPATKKPKPGELEQLFSDFNKADAELKKAEQAVEAQIQKRSDIVKSIGAFGNGPYEVDGKLLTVTSRKNEEAYGKALAGIDDPTKEQVEAATEKATRFFFKSTGEQTITKVGPLKKAG